MALSSSDHPPVHAEDAAHGAAAGNVSGGHATTEAEGHGGGGGLPQFDTTHWFGQAAYLLFLFVILYVLIARVFAPRLRRVLDERTETISSAVAAARQVQTEAADQAAAAKADLAKARAEARSLATAAKQRVADEANARLAAEESVVNARIAEAEAAIAKSRDAAMTHVSGIAADTASALVERLTGKAPAKADVAAALNGAT
ncbi:ATP synthase F0 subunit B' [Brevundimonas sp. Leaf363]|uniref:F0F1 ATP synthase subunit B family protein n=1 Tax=Brevundimonas sp. Leaf363 TaxID=1736353 RepID=UPI0006FA3CD0|nr:ATP synthase F0 subunit B' [Brevundimonas sp. Leaf363]KQS54370.1 ATP synthase F0 subunit B' [Brevundimonas sp. Leaf363]